MRNTLPTGMALEQGFIGSIVVISFAENRTLFAELNN